MSQPLRRFRIRLAGFLGKFPFEIDRMPMSEFMECYLYEQLEPFGDIRGDLQAGVIASTLINLKLKRGADPIRPDRFVPKRIWEDWINPQAEKVMTAEEQFVMMLAIQAAQNASLKKKN